MQCWAGFGREGEVLFCFGFNSLVRNWYGNELEINENCNNFFIFLRWD